MTNQNLEPDDLATEICLFPIGRIVMTRTVKAATTPPHRYACLRRHVSGDWGEMSEACAMANREFVAVGGQILSVYPLDPDQPGSGNTFWIVTLSDRSLTGLLLPDECRGDDGTLLPRRRFRRGR